jgi:signal transduction histidine kinase
MARQEHVPPADGGPTPGTGDGGLARENEKLRKINRVLMQRVERSMDMQGTDFALFETAILLEGRIRERTAALEQALDELRHSNTALEEAKAEAERANVGKTQFLAAASHDLLQPLNAARLFVSALAETRQSQANRELIANIDLAFDAVERLLGALLDISKLDAGVLVPEIADVPVGALLKSLAAEFRPMAEEHGLELRVVPCHATIQTDPHLLTRVLRNLLSNAIRYTEAGRVLIGCRRAGRAIRIEVRDTGIGIPLDKQSEIFEEFRRLGGDRHAHDRGFGLGLAIVRRIARMLDHPLTVKSRPEGGSCFAVTVPPGRALAPAIEVRREPAAPGSGLFGARVLVLENETSIQEGMRVLLEAWGCRVDTAGTGQEPAEGWDRADPSLDLVIADYHLDEGLLGIDAIKGIRGRLGRHIPAVVITADRTPEVQKHIQGQGIPVLNKPIRPAKLRALMSHLIGAGSEGYL